MATFFSLFDTEGFHPRWECGETWKQEPHLGWLHIGSDLVTWGAYAVIPLVLTYFLLRRRRDLPFPRLFLLFAVFILACGTVHLIEAILFWQPFYRLSAVVKVITAIVSAATVVALIPIVPRALALRSPKELEEEIRHRQRVEEELRAAKEDAEAANRAKDGFLANMSHEIRTPMNAILGLTEVVLNMDLEEAQREYLTTVLGSAESLLTVLDDILDFSKIEAGKLDIEEVPFNVHDTVTDTLKSFALQVHYKKLELLCFIEPSVPSEFIGDPVRLRQVLTNLVNNAIKFTEAGEILVRVEPIEREDSEYTLHFSVRDSGPGIPQNQLESIFQPFEQLDTKTTQPVAGTGLGLAICQRIVQLLEGKIWAESQAGEGSTFHFEVPYKLTEGSKDALKALPKTENTRVLIVDDSASNRTTLEAIVQAQGMEPVVTTSAEEALQVLRDAHEDNEPISLVLSDVNMPDTNGYKLAEQIRAEEKINPVDIIFLTSSQQPGDQQRLAQLNIAAGLIKPVKQSELLHVMMRVLGKAELETKGWQTLGQQPKLHLPPLQILLVEDSPPNQLLALALLERAGRTTVVATNGQEALDALAIQPFDVVLMDIQMPVMDGLEATAKIREQEKGTDHHQRIIAMTAFAMSGDREKYLKAGMDDYISKPVRTDELLSTLARTMALGETTKPRDEQNVFRLESRPPRINLSKPLRQLNDNREGFRKIVGIYVKEINEILEQLPTLIAQKEGEEAMRFAHTLKTGMRYFSATNEYERTLDLENALKELDFEKAAELVDPLQEEVREILPLLQRFIDHDVI